MPSSIHQGHLHTGLCTNDKPKHFTPNKNSLTQRIKEIGRGWNEKVGSDAHKDWKEVAAGPLHNGLTNDRELRLLEFASYYDVVLANTLDEYTLAMMDLTCS